MAAAELDEAGVLLLTALHAGSLASGHSEQEERKKTHARVQQTETKALKVEL